MLKKLTRSRFGVAAIVAVAVFLIIFAGGRGLPQATYRPGWEIATEVVALKEGSKLKTFAAISNVQFDFDDPTRGEPDIKVSVGDVREEKPKMPYATLTQDYAKYKYVIDYHEYTYEVQIRTIAACALNNGNSETPRTVLGIVRTNYWEHETIMGWSYCMNVDEHGGSFYGKNAAGEVYVRFSDLPWGVLDYGPVPANYTFKGYWLGIMNAKVDKVVAGAVVDNEQVWKGWSRNLPSVGSQCNLYKDDGTYAQQFATIPWDATKILDPDISSVIIIGLPYDLAAGAWERYNAWGGYAANGAIDELKPVDYYATYTIRTECLVVKEYAARDPGVPANPSVIETPKDYVPYTPLSFWDKYGTWIIIAVIAFIVLALIFAWLFGGSLLMLMFMRRR